MADPGPTVAALDEILISDDAIPTLSIPLQHEIVRSLWPNIPLEMVQYEQGRQAAYFWYFRSELDAWRLSGSPVAIHSYKDLLGLVRHLRSTKNIPRDSELVSEYFQQSRLHGAGNAQSVHHRDVSINNALDLAIRLWLMLYVGCDSAVLYPGRSRLVWGKSETLNDFVQKCFPARVLDTRPKNEEGPLLVPAGMNIHSLKRVGGFDIVWTDHLADHLLLNDDLGTISLFHHASLLQMILGGDAAE